MNDKYFPYKFLENNQLEDPRQQWHEEQQSMLRDYLQRNEHDIEVW